MPQNLWPSRFRCPQTRHTRADTPLADASAMSSVVSSASISAAMRWTTSRAAAIASLLGLGRRTSECSWRWTSSNSELSSGSGSCGFTLACLGSFLSLSTIGSTCRNSSPRLPLSGWKTRLCPQFQWALRYRLRGGISTCARSAERDDHPSDRRFPGSADCERGHRCR